MLLTVISRNRVNFLSLPEKTTGQYWLSDPDCITQESLISVEGINDEWRIKSNRHVKLEDRNGNSLKSVSLSPQSIYLLSKNNAEKLIVFTEPSTDDRQIFTKYLIDRNIELSIGRKSGKDICYSNNFVSTDHATLLYTEGRWYLRDDNSSNGTFVNEKRVMTTELSIGDCVYIMGMKIIIGRGFIAINNPDGLVHISDKIHKLTVPKALPYDDEDEYDLAEPTYFYRSPRFKRDIETVEFKIDPPPTNPIGDELPWGLVIGSSLSMGMLSVVMLVTAILTNNITSMVMSGIMLVGMLFLPLITKVVERARRHKKEVLRQKKYREYLDKIAIQINEACKQQETILNENCITIQECEDRISQAGRTLWERGIGQNDFLRVRLGHGNGRLNAGFSYQERKFSIEEDNLQEEYYSLCEKSKTLHNVPVTYSIFNDWVSGIIGDRRIVKEFTKGLIIQLSALYSYDEVKFVFLYDQQESGEFEFVKWLPHVWSDDNKFRFVATDSSEVKEISAYLEGEISARLEVKEGARINITPYYVIFSMSKKLAPHADMLKQILASRENIGMSLITMYDELRSLPKECSIVVELANDSGRIFDRDDISGQSTSFVPDIFPTKNPLDLSVRLSNILLDTVSDNYKLPSMITFLEMFGVGKVEHLNSLTRWKENDPTKSLEAAIGVDPLGELFKLDLHEKYHGPHGLVAGMTGSGKSEFIITYILSLAVNYHPNEVAFILIDYKGGGMAKSFEKLPHTAGIITNLDGAAIKRSLVSIESELKRRQAIFAEASKNIGVSNIDIYKYQRLYREGSVSEPLQHLFIISDEFAELKTQQPEFMTQLVSAARIGRSLGVHLILATQKPSGVVDAQIWSNSKFRVCLKVQERADSMDMLKRPDAAELTSTGRFYLQVGYNELFELGQSAWAGAPYYPSERVQKEKDDSIVVVDMNGRPLKEAKIDHRKNNTITNARKQLDVITDYLKNIADGEKIKIRQLWLEPIPAVIMLDDIRKKYRTESRKYRLNPVIGEYDDPEKQQQCVLRLPLSDEGNVIIYGSAGSGKTTFINALLFSLIHEHTPDEVNIYVLDFAAETLRAFSKAPHVGDVILSYDDEKVRNLFKMLRGEINKRKKLFADHGGDYSSYIRASEQSLPSIVAVISNYSAFTELYRSMEDQVSYIASEGTRYGIYLILTSLGVGGVHFKLLQNFKQLITLQLNDEADYSIIVGKTDGLVPSKFKGRGLIKRDKLYEFQTASITKDDIPFEFIQTECEKLSKEWTGKIAKKVPVLPDIVDIAFLKDHLSNADSLNIPVGVEKNSLNVHYYPFGKKYINFIISAGNDYRDFISELAVLAGVHINKTGIIFDVPKSIKKDTGSLVHAATVQECLDELDKLFDLILYRNNTFKTAAKEGTPCEEFDEVLVVINSLKMLNDILDEINKVKLSRILEKGSVDYKVTLIIGENVKAITAVNTEKWFKDNTSQSDGIWVGNGFNDQYQLKAGRITPDMKEDITSDFGYSLIDGKAVRIKLLSENTEDSAYDEG